MANVKESERFLSTFGGKINNSNFKVLESNPFKMLNTKQVKNKSSILNKLLVIVVMLFFVISCNGFNDSNELHELTEIEMTPESTKAFDALNTLQGSTQGHLYSSFVNSINSSSKPDTSFVLSQNELKEAISRITTRYGNKLSPKEYEMLVESSVMAQEEYYVEYFSLNSNLKNIGIPMNGIPTAGKWIVRGILNRRDLILEW